MNLSRPVAATIACAMVLTACAAPATTPSTPASDAASPSESPTATSSPSELPSPPEPSQPAGPPTIAWEEPTAFDGVALEVIADGDTWVAVGRALERGPAAWTSSDARTWARAEVVDPQPDDTFPGSTLGPTVRLGESLLSFGTFIGCCDGRGVLGWRSTDGMSWEVIQSDSPLFRTGYLVTGLAVGDPALVAIEGGYSGYSGRIWRWTEETSWIEATPGTAGTDQPSGIQFEDVLWAEGRFVAVGSRGDPLGAGPVTATSWTSSDGETWEESMPVAELADALLLQVAARPGGGFVALGLDDGARYGVNGDPVAFTSPDGLAWTPAEAPSAEPVARPVEILSVDGGLVAIGSRADTVIWTSADGLSWVDAGGFDRYFFAAAARDDEVVFITGDPSGVGARSVHLGVVGR